MFPLGGLMKQEVRYCFESSVAQCPKTGQPGHLFLGKINYNDFVRRFGRKEGGLLNWKLGKILVPIVVIGFILSAQRKGLGLSGGPWFVFVKIFGEIIYVSTDMKWN